MVGELLVGLIAIAVGIGVGLSPIWYILHGERKTIQEIQTQMNTKLKEVEVQVRTTNDRLQRIVMSGVDEKIAVFTTFIDYVQTWKNKQTTTEPAYKNFIDRVKSDVNALAKYTLLMDVNQRVNVQGVLRKIIETLENKSYREEAGELKDLSTILFSPSS